MKYFIIATFLLSHSAWANRTYQSALAERYPGCKLDKEIIYLTPKQVKAIEEKTKSKVYSKIQLRFFNHCTKNFVYIDSHIVRTLNETVMFEVDKNHLKHLEIVSFMEPPEYKTPTKWVDKNLIGKAYKDNLDLGEGIDSLSGATLSVNAISKSVKRILTLNHLSPKHEK